MATLADVIRKRRQSGEGVGSSLAGSLKEKLKEKFDPRRIFKQDGIMTALFPQLKAFKATGTRESGSSLNKKTVEMISTSSSISGNELTVIRKNTEITAKNSMVLPGLARDMNIMRQNISKLLKSFGVKPTNKADSFFKRSREREKSYESQLASLESKQVAPSKVEGDDEKKDDKGGFITKLLSFATSIADTIVGLVSGLFTTLTKTLSAVMKPIVSFAKQAFLSMISLIGPFISKILKAVMNIFKLSNFKMLIGRFLLGSAGMGILSTAFASIAVLYGLNSISDKIKQARLDKFSKDPQKALAEAREMENMAGTLMSNLTGTGTENVKQMYIATELMKRDPSLTAGQALNNATLIMENKEPGTQSAPSEFSGMETEGAVEAMSLSGENQKLLTQAQNLVSTGRAVNVESGADDKFFSDIDTGGIESPSTPPAAQPADTSPPKQGAIVNQQTMENKELLQNYEMDDTSESIIAPINQSNTTGTEVSQDGMADVVNRDIINYFDLMGQGTRGNYV